MNCHELALLNSNVWRCSNGHPGPESYIPACQSLPWVNPGEEYPFPLITCYITFARSIWWSDQILTHTHSYQPLWGVEVVCKEWADAKNMPWRPQNDSNSRPWTGPHKLFTYPQGEYQSLFQGEQSLDTLHLFRYAQLPSSPQEEVLALNTSLLPTKENGQNKK